MVVCGFVIVSMDMHVSWGQRVECWLRVLVVWKPPSGMLGWVGNRGVCVCVFDLMKVSSSKVQVESEVKITLFNTA